jgi:uncharacterized protein (DUF2336 family)
MTDNQASEDLKLLVAMARDKSAAGRKALVDAVGDLFRNKGDVLSDLERALMSEILRQIIHEVEMSVRRRLSDRLAQMKDAPHDLILRLANDSIEVAHPILIDSDLLHDIDLVEIIQHRTLQHQLAIAMRRNLSESVTEALVETGNSDVIKTMLGNPEARLSKATMEYLVEEAKRMDGYQNPLLHRPDLEPELAKRMYWWVSAALRQHIIEHFDIDPFDLDATLETTVRDIMSDDASAALARPKPIELADQLGRDGSITAELLVKVLRQGEVSLFEALFAKLSGLAPKALRRIIFDSGGEALAVACKGIAIPKAEFASIFMLTRKARPGKETTDPHEMTRVLAIFDRVHPESARAMVRRWQRDPDFLDAVDKLEGVDGSAENTRNSSAPAGSPAKRGKT